jgi:acyl-coenzyme A synthetase/AMP-(fatty) acid ligase
VDTASGKQVLFQDVEKNTLKVASALKKLGFQHGDSVYFVTYDFVDLGVLQLAVWMLGGFTRGGFLNESIGICKFLNQVSFDEVFINPR